MDYDDSFYLDERIHLAVDNVPWDRKGHPHWRREDSLEGKWGNQVANTSPKYKRRLYSDEWAIEHKVSPSSFIEERIFAMFWDYENNGRTNPSLYQIIDDPEISGRINSINDMKLVEYTAQSVIQWLGTNCGSCFIDEVRKHAKEHGEKLDKKIHPEKYERMREIEREEKMKKEDEKYRNKMMLRGLKKGAKKKCSI